MLPYIIGYLGIAGLHALVGSAVGGIGGGFMILGSPIWPIMDAYFAFMIAMDRRDLHRARKLRKRSGTS